MLVDPNTGQPIGVAAQSMGENYAPQSLIGATGINTAQRAGIENTHLMRFLEHIPGAATTMGWNMGRGGNTILRGGYSRMGHIGREGMLGSFRQGVAGFGTNPRAYTRLASPMNIDPYPNLKAYTPFQAISRFGNWAGRKGPIQSRLAARGLVEYGPGFGPSGTNELFSSGTMSRINAASRLGMNPTPSAFGNVANFLKQTNTPLFNAANEAKMFASGTTDDVAGILRGSGRGAISQAFGGYVHGAGVGAYSESAQSVLRRGGSDMAIRGAQKAASHLGGIGLERAAGGGLRIGGAGGAKLAGKLGMEVGEKAGVRAIGTGLTRMGLKAGAKGGTALLAGAMAIPGVNIAATVVTTAMLAYDLTQMSIEAMTGAADFAIDAGRSLKGSIDKPVMGMGYQDTTVAATSRARGVQAIANSRLNARSVLGSESSMLAAHFG